MDALLLNAFHSLHLALYTRLRTLNIALQAISNAKTVATPQPSQPAETVAFVRLPGEGQAVERLIGLRAGDHIDLKHHPVIELRLTETWLALEFILNPQAWYDQRNWLGKLSVRRYRDEFHGLLGALPPDIKVGAWVGLEPSERVLTSEQLRFPKVFEAWVGTYSDGRDWLRMGVWHPVSALDDTALPALLFEQLQALYGVYQFLSWTGRNDFYGLFRPHGDEPSGGEAV